MQEVVRKPNWKVVSKPKMKLTAFATNEQTNKLMDGWKDRVHKSYKTQEENVEKLDQNS